MTSSHLPRARPACAVVLLLLFPACATTDDAPVDLGTTSQALAIETLAPIMLPSTSPAAGGSLALGIKENLDRQTIAPARFELVGALNNVPVSGIHTFAISVAALEFLDVRVTGCGASDATADPALLATYGGACGTRTMFNDNATAGSRDPGLSFNACASARTITLHAFSLKRATAKHCAIQFRKHGGVEPGPWQTLATAHLGGTLVGVGPMPSNDYVTVDTRTDGQESVQDTHMYLFDLGSAADGCDGDEVTCYSTNSVLVNTGVSTAERDPRIVVTDGARVDTRNFVLLAKSAPSSRTPEGIETRVQLEHGPVRDRVAAGKTCPGLATPTCAGAAASMAPGRYYVSLYARVANAPEHFTHGGFDPLVASTMHPSSDLPQFRKSNGLHECLPGSLRGRPNAVALRMFLQTSSDGGQRWETAQTRMIPLSYLGTRKGGDWNAFVFEVELPATTLVRVGTDQLDASVEVYANWMHHRNADATELKVASLNTFYEQNQDSSYNGMKNMALLLGGRGWIEEGAGVVHERNDRGGRFELEADVIVMQENDQEDLSDPDDPTNITWIMKDTLHRYGLEGWWTHHSGRGEKAVSPCSGYCSGDMSTLVNRSLWPDDGDERSVKFTAAEMAENVNCSHPFYGDGKSCRLEDTTSSPWRNFTTPVKALARRPSVDRPVTVFNIHMDSETGEARLEEIESFIAVVKDLIAASPRAFNSDGSPAHDHRDNRFIIIGDTNLRAQSCGSMVHFEHRLREAFGYAVDVAAATMTDDFRTLGMHEASPLWDGTGRLAQSYDAACDPDLVDDLSPGRECPLDFQSFWNWRAGEVALPDSAYPWWAATFRSTAKNQFAERHDVIMLVGRGWAYDDPIVGYTLVRPQPEVSPLNPNGGAVELDGDDDIVGVGLVNGWPNYHPRFSVGGAGTNRGAPAARLDHVPIVARLRTYLR